MRDFHHLVHSVLRESNSWRVVVNTKSAVFHSKERAQAFCEGVPDPMRVIDSPFFRVALLSEAADDHSWEEEIPEEELKAYVDKEMEDYKAVGMNDDWDTFPYGV